MPVYFACEWHHDLPGEPVLLYEELDDQRYETRKVEEYRDGRRLRSDQIQPDRTPTLSWVEVPSLDEIAADPQFTVLPLTPEQFQAVWDAAVDS